MIGENRRKVAMNNMAKLPSELSVPISRAQLKPHRGTGNFGVLTGLAGYWDRQVARMATAGPYGFRPTGSVHKRRGIGEQLWLLRQSHHRAFPGYFTTDSPTLG
jgi:hypothetical protein